MPQKLCSRKKKSVHHFVSKVINPQCPSTRTFSEGVHQQKNIQKILFFQPSSHLRHQIQQMVNWWFGAPVVWIPGIPLWKGIGILRGTRFESQTTNRNHQFIIGWQNGCYRWWVDVGWLFTPKASWGIFSRWISRWIKRWILGPISRLTKAACSLMPLGSPSKPPLQFEKAHLLPPSQQRVTASRCLKMEKKHSLEWNFQRSISLEVQRQD